DKYKSSIKKRINSWTESSFDWASDYIYGIEADYRLVKTAKVSCFLNGDGLANVIHADGLDNFKKSTEYRGKLKETLQGEPKDNGQFDILAANPPYSVSAFKNTLKNGEQSFELYDRLTDDSSEIECLFIERTKQLLRVGGWAGIILPSSILSNTGIYSDARAIILKYFNIKGITSFGPNTFMATGTNTIVMFMERRPDHDWKKIEAAIKQFFESPKETTVNGIEKAFGKYASEVFDKLSLQDYISFVNKAPNKAMESQELFVDYKAWFNDLTEIKRLKDSKIFKDKAIREQQNELDNLFFKKTFERESEKLLYFFLTYSQKSVVVRMGEKEAEKEFLGYEFSNRRGHEGIKMYKDENGKDSTRLYDDTILLNPEKANTHIYRQFLENPITIPSDLSSNVTLMSTRDLMDFKKVMFENALSLEAKKKDVSVIWDYETLEFLNVIADIQKGTSFTSAELQDGTVPVVAGGQKAAYYHSEANRSGNIITVSASGAYAGFVNYWTQPIFASDCITIKSKDERVISTKLIYVFLRSIQDIIYTLRKPAQAQPHIYSSEIERIKLPILPKPIQAEVLKDLESIEMEERKEVAKIEKIRDGIDARINSLTSENDLTIISKIADVGGGKRVPKGFRPLSSKTDYPYIRVTDFENGSVSMANLKYLNEATFKK
ncbi:MAG TPA: N-6 DNA methylase, partial [Rhabdochlamydiaceae bacterium]